MSKHEEAIENYDESIALCPNNENFCKEIAKKKDKIKNEINAQKSNLNGNNYQCDQSIRSRLAQNPNLIHEKDLKPKEDLNCQETRSEFIKMMEIASCNPNLPKELFGYLDKSVPSYKLDSYPALCDIPKCSQRIKSFYEYTKLRYMNYVSYKLDLKSNDSMDMFKRLGDITPQTIEWYTNSKLGEVNTNPESSEYNPTVLHSFSNQINRSEILTPGTTHVAIGFTDLGFFHTAKFNAELTPEKPLKWFGYEASAYCCAKTAIITTMMMMNAPSDHVLQVWYSATWSKETLKSFKNAIEMVLNSK